MFGRKKIAIIVAEFLGTATLAVAIYSMVARTSFPLFSGLAAGGTLALMTLAIGSVSGAHINPAVTLGLWTLKKISTLRAIVYITAQMLGGLAAWGLLKYFLGRSLESIAGAKFDWKVFVAEAVGTFVFTFGVAAVLDKKYEGGQKAAGLGIALALGILVASMASNAVINPAVAVGIQSWNWAYAAAPIVGAIIGMNLYTLVFTGLPAASTVKVSAKRTTKKRR